MTSRATVSFPRRTVLCKVDQSLSDSIQFLLTDDVMLEDERMNDRNHHELGILCLRLYEHDDSRLYHNLYALLMKETRHTESQMRSFGLFCIHR
jgi:hypothetical protein